MLRNSLLTALLFLSVTSFGQIKWHNIDSLYQPLPKSVHVFTTDSSLEGAPFKAFYLIADLKNKQLDFTVDTTLNRRLTPIQFYQKDDQPLAVVNCTFFSFETNRNLNVVVKDGKLVGYNVHTIAGKGKDTFTYRHVYPSVIGISKKRRADIIYSLTDSSSHVLYATESVYPIKKDSSSVIHFAAAKKMKYESATNERGRIFHKWKVQTAVGGGPVLVQNGEVKITNNEELKFAGKAINDKHPRTAMGYTNEGQLIILAVQGRSESASGATLIQEAQILKDLGCVEALNLDGGGSSCLLVNGKQTIKPSDKEGQRPVPAVFLIKEK